MLVGKYEEIKKILAENSFDIVFHFAAFINNEESIRYPKKYYENNFTKGKIFIENCINNNVNIFFIIFCL